MSQQLPPLNALRVFEAVARHNSFTRAAEELCVTRAAISHQIKHLEEFLGFALVERHNRNITLTRSGAAALPKLREGFNNLSDAVHQMRIKNHKNHEKLNVWMAPSFASKWLIPRLPHFSSQYPDIEMRISGEAKLINATEKDGFMDELFRQHDIDVMIRFGSGHYPSCHVKKLFDVEAVPLCSPLLLENSPHPLLKPDDLQHHNLLHDETPYIGRPSWGRWLELAGAKHIDANRGMHFNHILLAIGAAIDNQGVLLSMDALAKYDIDAGRLCIPFALSMPLEHTYHIIRPTSATSNQKAADAFVNWVMEEVADYAQENMR